MASAPLNATYCNSCEHIFLTDIDRDFNSKIYSEYYYLYPFSELEFMMEAYRKPFEKIFNYFSHHEAPKKNLLEIGCSSEQQLDIFISKGYECTGISPGAESSENINLIDGFYESVKFESNFDYIVSRFNLEHIIDLNKFLKKVYKELRDDGLFFVQVPNVLSFLKNVDNILLLLVFPIFFLFCDCIFDQFNFAIILSHFHASLSLVIHSKFVVHILLFYVLFVLFLTILDKF